MKKGYKFSEESKLKISHALKGKPKSLEHRRKLSEVRKQKPNRYWLGKKRSQEDVEKFRISHLGKKQSSETIRKRILKGEQHYKWGIGNMDGRTRRKYAPRPCPSNCEACGIPVSELKKGLFLDHCHKSNLFRGWLCTRCNVALGMAKDDPEILLLLIKYLEKYGSDIG